MQFFYVKKDATLSLPHKSKALKAPNADQLAANAISVDSVYGGFVAWEIIHAKRLIGDENVVGLSSSQMPKSLNSNQLKSYADEGSLVLQLAERVASNTGDASNPYRIALVNGTGTMLGDTVIGASIVEYVAARLKAQGLHVQIDVVLAWNARPGCEIVWKRVPCVHQVFESSVTVAQLQSYHAYWDFSQLLKLPGYDSKHFADFYLNQFGIDSAETPDKFKLPRVRVAKNAYLETKGLFQEFAGGQPIVLIQAEASNPARSMPETFLLKLLKHLVKHLGSKIVLARELPGGLDADEISHIQSVAAWTKDNLDRYLAVVAAADFVITVDTLALHVAMGCQKPGVGLFSLSKPDARLKYSPQINGILIPEAEKLAYWNKHKSDELWAEQAASYERAWSALKIQQIMQPLQTFLKLPIC